MIKITPNKINTSVNIRRKNQLTKDEIESFENSFPQKPEKTEITINKKIEYPSKRSIAQIEQEEEPETLENKIKEKIEIMPPNKFRNKPKVLENEPEEELEEPSKPKYENQVGSKINVYPKKLETKSRTFLAKPKYEFNSKNILNTKTN